MILRSPHQTGDAKPLTANQNRETIVKNTAAIMKQIGTLTPAINPKINNGSWQVQEPADRFGKLNVTEKNKMAGPFKLRGQYFPADQMNGVSLAFQHPFEGDHGVAFGTVTLGSQILRYLYGNG